MDERDLAFWALVFTALISDGFIMYLTWKELRRGTDGRSKTNDRGPVSRRASCDASADYADREVLRDEGN
jgi:hypothetical protein